MCELCTWSVIHKQNHGLLPEHVHHVTATDLVFLPELLPDVRFDLNLWFHFLIHRTLHTQPTDFTYKQLSDSTHCSINSVTYWQVNMVSMS